MNLARTRKNGVGMAWREKLTFEPPPVVTPRWELLLEELGLSEQDALAWLRAEPSVTGKRIASWVKLHWWHCYVPETVLRALKIHIEDDVFSVGLAAGARHWARHTAPKPQYGASLEGGGL